MAKKPVVSTDAIDKDLLASIVHATAENTLAYVSQVQGQPMLAHNPPLIEINVTMLDPNDGTKVAARSTEAANAYLAAASAPVNGATVAPSNYAIITGAVLPEPKKRGNSFGSGAPTKYPFADLPVGGMFFSANTEHAKQDAVKALGSTVSSQNNKYSEPTGEKKTTTRAVRDPKTHKAVIGADGKKVTETVELDVKKYNRKFTIRPVTAGKNYGSWTAPADGALIARVL